MTRQTKLKLRKGFVNAPLTYKVLAINAVKPKDFKVIAKTLAKTNTDSQAKKLTNAIDSDWSYTYEKSFGTPRIGILKYKGIEVAVFFKRVTVIVEPAPEDPVPEDYLEHEEDVWCRFDLLGKSIRQQHNVIRLDMDLQAKENQMLQVEVDQQENVIAGLNLQIRNLQSQLKALQTERNTKACPTIPKSKRSKTKSAR